MRRRLLNYNLTGLSVISAAEMRQQYADEHYRRSRRYSGEYQRYYLPRFEIYGLKHN